MFRVSRNTQKPLANKLEPQKKAIENFTELIGKCFRLNSQDVVRTQMENFFAGAISLENLCNKLNLDINDFKLGCKEILRLSEDNHHYINIRLIQPAYTQSRDVSYDNTSSAIFIYAEELDKFFNDLFGNKYRQYFPTEINQRSVSSGSAHINTELNVDNNNTLSPTKEELELYAFISDMSTVKNITFNKLTQFIQNGKYYTLEHLCRDIGLIELNKIEELKSKYPNIIESHRIWGGVRHHFCKEKFSNINIDAVLSEKFIVKVKKDNNSLKKDTIKSLKEINEVADLADDFLLLQDSVSDNNELGNVELQEFNSTLTVEDKKKLLTSFIEKLFDLGILEHEFMAFFSGQKSLETIFKDNHKIFFPLLKEYRKIFQDNRVRLANAVVNNSHFTPTNFYYDGAGHYYNPEYFSQEDMVKIRLFLNEALYEIQNRPKNDYLNLLDFLNSKSLDKDTYMQFLAGRIDLQDFCRKAQLNAGELLENFPHVFKKKDDVKHEICFIPMPIQHLSFESVAHYLNKNKLSKK
jgi:hypothetical protein